MEYTAENISSECFRTSHMFLDVLSVFVQEALPLKSLLPVPKQERKECSLSLYPRDKVIFFFSSSSSSSNCKHSPALARWFLLPFLMTSDIAARVLIFVAMERTWELRRTGSRTPIDIKIRGCSSPLYQMAWCILPSVSEHSASADQPSTTEFMDGEPGDTEPLVTEGRLYLKNTGWTES